MSTHRVAVIGGGSFGTALANICADNGHTATLWMRNAERAEALNREHENAHYLPGYPLNPQLRASADLQQCVEQADLVLMAVPSSSCRQVARDVAQWLAPGALVISTTKGIEADGFHLMSQVLRQELPSARIGVLSGPNLAKEIADRQPTAAVIASDDRDLQAIVQEVLHCGYFRVYSGSDMFGVELGGALKNIYAIITGIAGALGVGENTKGMLLTRALAEMSRFAVHKGANPLTFLGLAGVGDLVVTCSSPLSRNFRVGMMLGEGRPLADILAQLGQVAEGVNTLRLVVDEARRHGVYMPLAQGLYDLIYGGEELAAVLERLMTGAGNQDVEFVLPEGCHG